MKKSMHKIGIGLFLLLFSYSAQAKRTSEELTKEIIETHKVTSNQKIEINTKFGELNITSWDKNEVGLDIKIKVKDNNEKKAQAILDRIRIEVVNTNDKFSVITHIDGNDEELKIKTSKEGYLEINYNIKVPAKNLLDIKSSFGAFFIDRMDASTKLDMKFGAATIGELNGDQNDLNFEFCDPIVISKLYGGKIKMKFSKLELLKSENLVLASEMSGAKVEKVTKAQFNLRFGSLDLNEVMDLTLESQMSSVNIESLHGKGVIKNKYGSLKIAHVKSSTESLKIDGEFSPMKIMLDKSASYQVSAECKMSGIKLPAGSIQEEMEVETSRPAIKTNSSFKGRIGAKTDKMTNLTITSSFGEVKLSVTD